jgi:hypothetical protein
VLGETERHLDAEGCRAGTLIVVTTEVVLGLVRGTPLGRWFP